MNVSDYADAIERLHALPPAVRAHLLSLASVLSPLERAGTFRAAAHRNQNLLNASGSAAGAGAESAK